MPVIPLGINADKTVSVIHLGTEHTGTIPFTDILQLGPDGNRIYTIAVLKCPECQTVSFHPISGGMDPIRIQQLFTLALLAAPEMGRQDLPPVTTWTQAKARVRAYVEMLEGPQRWMLESMPAPASRRNQKHILTSDLTL